MMRHFSTALSIEQCASSSSLPEVHGTKIGCDANPNEDSCSPNAQIVLVDDISVGVLVVERFLTHIQIEQIYLLPEYQHRGIGTALIKSLLFEAAKFKIPVRLRVMAVNLAKSFYERLGFMVTEATPEFCFMEKQP